MSVKYRWPKQIVAWQADICYAGTRREFHKEITGYILESLFNDFGENIDAKTVKWWFTKVLPPLIPEIYAPHITITPQPPSQYVVSVNLEHLSWDDTIIVYTLARMVDEFPSMVKTIYEFYKKYKQVVSLDTAVYYGMVDYDSEMWANSNHLLTSARLHKGPLLTDQVINYNIKQRWLDYKPKYPVQDLGNSTRLNLNFTIDVKDGRVGQHQKAEFLAALDKQKELAYA